MAKISAYVVVYDVSQDSERNRVAKILEGFGVRVQKSAFECLLTTASRRSLLRQLDALKLQSGFVYLYRRAGVRERLSAGCPPSDPQDEAHHAIVFSLQEGESNT
jgi:CRISPR-associated protein Cas2